MSQTNQTQCGNEGGWLRVKPAFFHCSSDALTCCAVYSCSVQNL